MAGDTTARVRALLSDPNVPMGDKQQALTLLPGVDATLRGRLASLLADPEVPDDAKRDALSLLPERAPEPPAGTRADLLNLGRSAASHAVEFVKDQGPEMAGGTLGGYAGAAIPTALGAPYLAPFTGPAGAALGTVLGDVGKRMVRGQPMPTKGDVALDAAGAVVPELGAQALLGLTRKVFGVSRAMHAGDVANRAAAERLGIDYLPGDVNPNVAPFQTDLARLPTSARTIDEATVRRGRQTKAAGERVLVEPLGVGRPTATEAGESVRELAKPTLRAVKSLGRQRYETAEAAARALHLEAPVPATVTQTADEVLADLAEGVPEAQAGRARAILERLSDRAKPTTAQSPILGPRGQAITNTVPPTALSFDELIGIKRDLNEVLPTYERRGMATKFSTGALERLHGQVDDVLDQMAAGTRVEPLWREAKEYWRDEVAPLRRWVEGVAPRSDDEVLDLLVRAKRPERLRILFRHLETSPEGAAAANELRASWFANALDATTDPHTGALNPERFFSSWRRLGPEVQAVLTGTRAGQVDELMSLIAGQARGAAAGANPSGTARGVLRAGQLGLLSKGAYDAVASGSPAGAASELAGTVLLGGVPAGAAALLTSRPGRRYLTGGLRPVPGAGLATRAAGQGLGRWAVDQGIAPQQ